MSKLPDDARSWVKLYSAAGAMLLLGILFIAMLPKIKASLRERAKLNYTKYGAQRIADASTNFYSVYTNWPVSLAELCGENPRKALFVPHTQQTNDGWGRGIIYRPFDASVGHGSVISYGRDGRPGGQGWDKDIEVRFGNGTN